MDSTHADWITPAGLPHSEICGLMGICPSPQLIAACRVLLRLLMPRHSPCALSSLTWFSIRLNYAGFTVWKLYLVTLRLSTDFHNDSSYDNVIIRLPLCCLTCVFHHVVQFSRCAPDFETGLKHSTSLNASICPQTLVEISGIEPLTSCLQGRRSPG